MNSTLSSVTQSAITLATLNSTSLNLLNNTINSSTTANYVDVMNRKEVKYTFSILYILIFVFGLFGNIMIIYVVCQNPGLRKIVTNIFIANLAVADIMMTVLCVPFTPLYSFMGRWPFGTFMCRILSMAQCMSIYLSTFTLTFIAYDRYRVILFPFATRMSIPGSLYRIAGMWIVSTLISAPLAVFQHITRYPDDSNLYCEENWPSVPMRRAYSSVNILAQFTIPLISITYWYHRVSREMSHKAKQNIHGKQKNSERKDLKRKKRINIMMYTMILLFSLCWLPLNFVIVFFEFNSHLLWWKYYTLVFFISHLLAMSSICHNPIIYAWFNPNFQAEFLALIPNVCRKKGHETHDLGNKSEYTQGKLCKKGSFNSQYSEKKNQHNNETLRGDNSAKALLNGAPDNLSFSPNLTIDAQTYPNENDSFIDSRFEKKQNRQPKLNSISKKHSLLDPLLKLSRRISRKQHPQTMGDDLESVSLTTTTSGFHMIPKSKSIRPAPSNQHFSFLSPHSISLLIPSSSKINQQTSFLDSHKLSKPKKMDIPIISFSDEGLEDPIINSDMVETNSSSMLDKENHSKHAGDDSKVDSQHFEKLNSTQDSENKTLADTNSPKSLQIKNSAHENNDDTALIKLNEILDTSEKNSIEDGKIFNHVHDINNNLALSLQQYDAKLLETCSAKIYKI